MAHEEEAKLGAYIDKELSGTEKAAVLRHIQECPECRDRHMDMMELESKLKKSRDIEPSVSFRVKVNQSIDRLKISNPVFSIGKLIPIPIGLALLVVVFSAYMIAAPVVYGMNNESVKVGAADMVKKAVISCMAGSVFAPAVFAKFCGACTENACNCCGEKCGSNCKMMKGEKNGQ